jgi:ribonuclease I
MLGAALLAFVGAAPSPAPLAPLRPTQHGDFQHYTLALTWQPGWCSTGSGCLPDQPHATLIGVHGLWPSRPKMLIDAGMTDPQYWGKGCDAISHSDAAPSLDPKIAAELSVVMPHNHSSLLKHEYDKHVQCFGYDANTFFATELAMRDRIADSAFGKYLIAQAGHQVAHNDIVGAFYAAFGEKPSPSPSLQLQCEHDSSSRTILTQVWFTIHTEQVDAFPAAASLMETDPLQDTCPNSFYVPNW